MSRVHSVVILGAGKIGQAIAYFLQQNTSLPNIHFWDKDPTKVPEQLPLHDILPSASLVFYCIPSWALKSALDETACLVSETATVICVAKGIEPSSQQTIDELLASYFKKQQMALLLGPMLADEILRGLPAFATIATKDTKTFNIVHHLFKGSNLGVSHYPSPKDAAFASVLKNVYSLAMGLADGLEWGNNQKGILAARMFFEMDQIFKHIGYNPAVLQTPAGIPDFLATAFSPTSRNRILGEELVRAGTCSFQSEGFIALPSLIKRLHHKTSQFPILHTLRKTLLQGKHKEIARLFSKLTQM